MAPPPSKPRPDTEAAAAHAAAEAAGEGLEATGRRVRFACGALVGLVTGFLSLSNLYSGSPSVRESLDRAGAGGYILLVALFALAIGAAAAQFGEKAYRWADDLWQISRWFR